MTLLLSLVNWGEVYYSTYREYGEAKAEEVTEILDQLPLRIVPVDRPLVYLASRLKGRYPIAYGDCFAAALAIQRGTKVVTADPEFEKLAEEVEVIWV